MRSATEDLTHTLGRAPDDAELAAHLGVTGDDLQEARRADMVFHTYSLDAPVFDHQDPVLLADLLGADDQDVEQALDMEAVSAHWKELPVREQHILTMPFTASRRRPRSASGWAFPRCTCPGCWRGRSATCVTGCSGGTKRPTATSLTWHRKRRAGSARGEWRHPGAHSPGHR